MIYSKRQKAYTTRSSTKKIATAAFTLYAIISCTARAETFTFRHLSKNPHTDEVISIPKFGAGIPYPSTIALGPELITNVRDVNVRILSMEHSNLEDVDILSCQLF